MRQTRANFGLLCDIGSEESLKKGSHCPYESDGDGWGGLRRIWTVTNAFCYHSTRKHYGNQGASLPMGPLTPDN